jgi:murein DD-endopeptidase MepM/ murein hydrolase activator NlpD
LYQFHEIGAGTGGGTAVLSLETALFRSAPAPAFGNRSRSLRERVAELDLVTDLGVGIGSREWLRGFAICAGLCYAAISFAPGFDPLTRPAAAPLPDAQWEEARSLAISPLAYGADTGRRMAATQAVQPLADTPERPTIDLLATLGRGDGFARVLARAGVSRPEADQIEKMVAAVIPLDKITPGTTVDLTLGRRPNKRMSRPLDSLAFRAAFDLKLEVRRVGGTLSLVRIPIAVDNTPLRIQGRVGSSLYRSARAAGAPARSVEAFIRAIATHVSVGSISADDRFDLIVEHRRAATGETETGQLLYAGLDRGRGKDLQMMQWPQGGRSQWFEASGVGKASGSLQRPVPGTVSSNYGSRRHPILGYRRMHKGMDFRAGYGTPILSAADGKVVRAGWAGGYGKQVKIVHANGVSTSYSHMSNIKVRVGQTVRQGQSLGAVGSTGLSTGPHHHYEVYRNGAAVNPATFKFSTQAKLSGSELAGFRAKLRRLLGVRSGAGEETRSAKSSPAKPAKPAA